MTGSYKNSVDWINDLLVRSASRWDEPISLKTDHAECSHQYQVHGRLSPTKMTCPRCDTSWPIGARTEPS